MDEERSKNMKRRLKISESTINFLLIFILGFLVGVTIKTEAKKKITMGFNDYLVSGMKQQFDVMEPVTEPQDSSAPENSSQPENDSSGPQDSSEGQQ